MGSTSVTPKFEIEAPASTKFEVEAPQSAEAHIGVNRGPQTQPVENPNYYAGAPSSTPSGEGAGFIDRMTERFGANLRSGGQALLHPVDTLSGMLSATKSPVDVLSEQYAKDPANIAGDVMTMLLGRTVSGNPPGANLATVGRSEFVPSGVAHPIQGTVAGIKAMEPNLMEILKHPISSTVGKIPEAIRAGMGEPINVKPPVARPLPAWMTQPQEGTTISVLGSTPEEIKANLQRMAANQAARRGTAPPASATPAETPQVVQIPAGKTAKAVGPAYSSPRTPATMERPSGGGSATIDLHGYHPESQTMTVQFKNGNVYELRGVPPEIYENYRNAESQGSFYQQNLKGRYETRLVGKIGQKSAGAKVKQALSNQVQPTPKDLAFMKMNPPEEMSSGMTPSAEQAWQESAFGEAPLEDIGNKIRAQTPSVPRTKPKGK